MPMPSTLEGQIARYADRIAYLNHDIDDSIRAGILSEKDLPSATLAILGTTHSERIHTMVADLVAASTERAVVEMTPPVFEAMAEMREFLFERVYLSQVAPSTRAAVERIVETLLEYYTSHPAADQFEPEGEDDLVRAVDYVAGMTDRFAIRAFESIVGGPAPPVGV
jgi:dGTPase